MRIGQAVPAPRYLPSPAGKCLVVEGWVYEAPIQGAVIGSLAAKRHVVGRPGGALKGAAGVGDSPQISEEMWGFLWVSRGEDSRHRGEALRPDAYIGDQTAAQPLGVAAGAICLYLPGLGPEFRNVHVLLRNDFLYELRRDRAKAREVRRVLRGHSFVGHGSD